MRAVAVAVMGVRSVVADWTMVVTVPVRTGVPRIVVVPVPMQAAHRCHRKKAYQPNQKEGLKDHGSIV